MNNSLTPKPLSLPNAIIQSYHVDRCELGNPENYLQTNLAANILSEYFEGTVYNYDDSYLGCLITDVNRLA